MTRLSAHPTTNLHLLSEAYLVNADIFAFGLLTPVFALRIVTAVSLLIVEVA